MKTVYIYFITAAISFLATIPPGPLSVFVVHTTLQKSIQTALWVAIGGVFCESIFSFLAIQGFLIFNKYPAIEYWIHWAIIGLLLSVGTFTFFQTPSEIKDEKIALNTRLLSFIKGISLSFFNPALIPFWLIVLIEYRKIEFLTLETAIDKGFFVLGAATGTFLLVFSYAYIADKKREYIYKYLTYSRLNKIVGSIFVGLAIWQVVNILL